MTQQPATLGLFGGALGSNPYPFYDVIRRDTPVLQIGSMGIWAVSRYDDVLRILRDPETFSSVVGVRQLDGSLPPNMLFSDPPVHTRLRNLVARAFTPRMIEQQRPAIARRAADLVRQMLQQGDPDVVRDLAYPLPVMVIAEMLGVADGDLATFKRWSDDIIENVAPALLTGDDSTLAETNREFDAHFGPRLDALRASPADDLLSELVHAETEEGRLTRDELLMFCRLLLVAGNETTTGLIVNAVRVFAELPTVLRRVRSDPGTIPAAIEEVLRFYAPFQATLRRTTRAATVAGVTIPAGERVVLLLGSANRDERAFSRPDEFDLDREANRHLSFGMGIHYCLGAPLARLEAEVALAALLPRITGVEVLPDQDGALLRPGGPRELRVRFTPA